MSHVHDLYREFRCLTRIHFVFLLIQSFNIELIGDEAFQFIFFKIIRKFCMLA